MHCRIDETRPRHNRCCTVKRAGRYTDYLAKSLRPMILLVSCGSSQFLSRLAGNKRTGAREGPQHGIFAEYPRVPGTRIQKSCRIPNSGQCLPLFFRETVSSDFHPFKAKPAIIRHPVISGPLLYISLVRQLCRTTEAGPSGVALLLIARSADNT